MDNMDTVRTAFQTDRLILRPFELSDTEPLFKIILSDPEVARFMLYDVCPTLEAAYKRVDDWLNYFNSDVPGAWGLFAVELQSSGELIGTIDFSETDKDARSAEAGYQFGKAWWGKGYATEALRAVISHCFENVGLKRIWANYDPRNPGSGKVMQKAGMFYEGTLRQCAVRKGELVDRAYYAILSSDYFHKPQTQKVDSATYRKAANNDIDTVTDLTCELYQPLYQMPREEMAAENKLLFADPRQVFFLAFADDKPIGFAHCSLRDEYVNGTEFDGTKGYLEGIYILPEYRMNGVAAALVRLCEGWAKEHGCREFASGILIDNTDSYHFHLRLGFVETERVIFFRKEI
jgi:ribosomal-protein-alanine N-acetyltransferase